MIKFKFTERQTEEYNRWVSFYPKRDNSTPFKIKLEKWGYFDPRPKLIFNITSIVAIILPLISLYLLPVSIFFLFWGWGSVYMSLPIDTGKADECESPEYGLNTYSNDELWVYWGNKRKHIDLPWHLEWYRTSLLLKDGCWDHSYKGDRKSYWEDEWVDKRYQIESPYTYTTKYGEKQEAKAIVHVEELEWRRRWLYKLPIFNRISKDIQVNFDIEIGSEAGSWKGGVVGCGYEILNNETPFETLRRMERERSFCR